MFHLLYTYVASVASGCFKSRSGVAHVPIALVAGGQRPTVGLRHLAREECLALSSPSPSFPSLHLASALALEWGLSSLLRSDADAGMGWDVGHGWHGMGCGHGDVGWDAMWA
jgi:hypothetical protein